jgi:GAF domain-containing protein
MDPVGDNTRVPRQADHSSGQALPAGVGRDMADLARDLQAASSLDEVFERITHAAVARIEAAGWAGISEISGKNIRTRAVTDPLVTKIDELQLRAGDGPCLTSLRSEKTIRSDDLAAERRWPGFAHAAADAGVRSMLSVQLFVHDENLGALNLYSDTTDAFDDTDETTAILLAAHAATAIKSSRNEQHLRTALANRNIIGEAKGILIERYKLPSGAAFNLLVHISQRTNRKLRDIADEFVTTGELPTGVTPTPEADDEGR